ncbi:putative phage protein (TIGR02218 family) [Desulfosalsimonas propionicica]|uniref:Putative phage protein (TIGR02218 family) n=1 Tax=Desulfosalsimonas propionicica TaxID=332175 RepID=A0A7W0HL35_9BACT|nr:phage BR0599 family protein [Desulfosalsimonas propionicica]MBA2881840.1 putative phage protein (TIGR02218 family) [Desulfosalsimonas propionicica]
MGFTDLAYSVAGGKPYELYDFVRGTWDMYLTTRATELYVSDQQIYRPAPIKRSKIRHGEDLNKDAITLTVPRGHDLAAQFVNIAPERTTSVTIRSMQRGLTIADALVIWKGRVIGAEPRGEVVEISCESVYTSMRRSGLRYKAELICQHALYSADCGANQPAMRVDDTIAGISGTTLTMNATGAYENGWFSGGILENDGDARFITSHAGNTIVLSRPLAGLALGQAVALYPGCDRTMATCHSKFDNLDNHLGFAWVPGENPFMISIKTGGNGSITPPTDYILE